MLSDGMLTLNCCVFAVSRDRDHGEPEEVGPEEMGPEGMEPGGIIEVQLLLL